MGLFCLSKQILGVGWVVSSALEFLRPLLVAVMLWAIA